MKSLTTYINEKMIYNKSTTSKYKYCPKTKEELLKKYEGTEFYNVIKTHYGSKESFQNYDGGLLNFDEKSLPTF